MRKNKIKLNLPREYLSYSSFTSWTQNKGEFRRHYYEGQKSPETREMRFGHDFAKGLEEGTIDPAKIGLTRYSVSEHRIMTEISGVPILAFLDTFDPKTFQFRELKTGRVPWDKVRVHRHVQLPFYMLAIREAYGEYDKVCHLDWVGTRQKAAQESFGGVLMDSPDAGEIELTGRIESFKRSIPAWELNRMQAVIKRTALEISADYTEWQKGI